MAHSGYSQWRADEAEAMQRVWQHLIGPGALCDAPSEMRLAPHDIGVFLCSVRAHVPPVHVACRQPEPIHGSGCGLTRMAAQVAAFGEAIERYSARRCCARDAVRATYRDLRPYGVNPQGFALYADAHYEEPHFHFHRASETCEFYWVEGWSWLQQRLVYIPTCFVYLEPCFGSAGCLFHAVSTGLACSLIDDAARLAGLCEVIERDAIMIAWLTGLELPRLRQPVGDPFLIELYRRITAKGTQATVLDATTDVGLPVRIALVENRLGPPVECAVGMAAHPNPLQAHRKALLEACHTLNWLHQLQQKRRRLRRRVASFHPRTFEDHVFLYGHKELAHALDMWRCGPWRDELDPTQDALRAPQEFDHLVRRLAHLGLEVITVDVTPADVSAAGFKVFRTVVPGMQPLTPGRLSCTGGVRLRTVPEQMACRARYGPSRWNPFPHPFP